MRAARLAPTPMLLHCRLCERLLAATSKPISGVCECFNCILLSGFAFRYPSGIRYSVKSICVWNRFSLLTISGLPSGFNFRSADLISAFVVTMSTVVPTQVSSAEQKLRLKLSEQRDKEAAKLLDLRVKDASKVLSKLASTKMGLDALVNKQDFSTLPDQVREKLQHLLTKIDSINDQCNTIVETGGIDEGDILTLQDTIHT